MTHNVLAKHLNDMLEGQKFPIFINLNVLFSRNKQATPLHGLKEILDQACADIQLPGGAYYKLDSITYPLASFVKSNDEDESVNDQESLTQHLLFVVGSLRALNERLSTYNSTKLAKALFEFREELKKLEQNIDVL